MLLIGKPSISMGHLYHGYVSHNQRVPQAEHFNPINIYQCPWPTVESTINPPAQRNFLAHHFDSLQLGSKQPNWENNLITLGEI